MLDYHPLIPFSDPSQAYGSGSQLHEVPCGIWVHRRMGKQFSTLCHSQGCLGAQVLEKHSLHPRPHHFSPRETWLGTPISDCVLPPLSDVLAAGTPVSRKKCSLVPPAFRLPSESAPDTPAVQWKHRLTFHGRPPIGCSAADAV